MISVPERVKDALREGDRLKTYRFNVLNDDGSVDFTIDNDTLVYESVKFDERMCSGDTLKFGLCEGASLEFQYFDHPNITGRRIQSFIDVQYEGMTWNDITTLTTASNIYTCEEAGTYSFTCTTGNATCWVYIKRNGVQIDYVYFSRSDEEQTYTYTCEENDVLEFGTNYQTLSVDLKYYGKGLLWESIPMGFFTVKKCSRQASTGIQKVTAYNKLQSEYLDADAKDAILSMAKTGVPGGTSTVNVGLILDNLLEGYSIERRINRLEGTWAYYYTATSPDRYRRANASETLTDMRLHILSINLRFTPTDFNANNIYRGVAMCSAMYQRAKALIATEDLSEIVADTGTSPYVYATLENWFDCGKDLHGQDLANPLMTGISIIAGSGQTYASQELYISQYKTEESKTTDWMINVNNNGFNVIIPALYVWNTSSTYTWSQAEIELAESRADAIVKDAGLAYWEESAQSDIEKIRITATQAATFQNVTLRDLQSAVFEGQCQYGQLSRITDLFYGVELNHSALYPAGSLYPADTLYPSGTSETSFKSWYSKLWTDTVGEQSFRKLIITYKGLDENNVAMDFTLEKTVNANGTTDYVMDSNWLLKNLIWTQQDVQDLADAMAAKMQNIRWFPFEMWAAGLPYVETGDMIEIIVGDETHTSYVLQRQLSGIQNLQDTYINGTLDVF